MFHLPRQTLNSLLIETKTSREVADELGIRRQAITKPINKLRNAGLVATDGGNYSIWEWMLLSVPYRVKAVKALRVEVKIPTQIAADTGIRTNHVLNNS